MQISSPISFLSSTASLSSISLTSMDPIPSWTPHRPTTNTPAVQFWYEDDDGEDLAPPAGERFSGVFLEECRLCKRQLGAGIDAYMCAGLEAAFCTEDCRDEWLEMAATVSEENRRRRAAAMMNNALYSSIIVEPELCGSALCRSDHGAVVVG